ncbi:MAG: cytidine deaminase [Calditrichia bacterium]
MDILQQLKRVKEKALALYSNFKVGAILITDEGKIYTGHNIETSSYGLTICAERVALFKALSEGERHFNKIYIMGDSKDFCAPCGACRQVLHDFAPNLQVKLVNEQLETKSYSLKDLLPEAFTPDDLKKEGEL